MKALLISMTTYFIVCVNALALTIEIYGPCNSRPIIKQHVSLKSGQSVGAVTYNFLSEKNIDFTGSDYHLDTIWNRPTPKERYFTNAQQTRAFGWCYEVNGTQPAKRIDQMTLNNSDTLRWFLGFMPLNSHEFTPCTPAFQLNNNPLCQQHTQYKAEPRVAYDSPRIISWASKVIEYQKGERLDSQFALPNHALGPVNANPLDVVSLGEGGSIVLYFEQGLSDQVGVDFVVFENAFMETFLELAYVEVSSNGFDYARFNSLSKTSRPVASYQTLKADNFFGLAGKYNHREGQGFDLSWLKNTPQVQSRDVDLKKIYYIKIIDIIGDGSMIDSYFNPIFDPYPTYQSAGFDLAGIGVIHQIASK